MRLRATVFLLVTGGLLTGQIETQRLLAQESPFLPFGQPASSEREDSDYQAGTAALGANRFDEAIRRFQSVIAKKSPRADGAYYWEAYAQNRSGRPTEALTTIAAMRKSYPQSKWMDDAKALELEIHGQNGRPLSPADENNEDLKLIAINSLMGSDPNRAIPILRNLLSSRQPLNLKDRALFVLSQSSASEARQLLLDIARGKSDRELQFKAVRYLSMMGGEGARGQLSQLYASSNDTNLKREIIHGYLLSNSRAQLMQAAQGEKNEDLQREAIRTLAQTGGKEELWTLYKGSGSSGLKEEIVRSMLLDGDSAHLLQIAKTEKDPAIRNSAIRTLGLTGWGKDSGEMTSLYRNESDPSIKHEIVQAMFIQQNAKGLIELARQEKNAELKREIIQQLSLIHSKEATDYMMEILK